MTLHKKLHNLLWLVFIIAVALLQTGAARSSQYDEEAREQEKLDKQAAKEAPSTGEGYRPVRGMASGVKEATVDSTKQLLADTAGGASDGGPIAGTLDGARQGSGKAMDSAIKGAMKVATLGYADVKKVDVEQPEADSGDVTKFKISL
jgi:hypothetical protein